MQPADVPTPHVAAAEPAVAQQRNDEEESVAPEHRKMQPADVQTSYVAAAEPALAQHQDVEEEAVDSELPDAHEDIEHLYE